MPYMWWSALLACVLLAVAKSDVLPPSEAQALVCLYEMTDGPHWDIKYGWNISEPETACSWEGVFCSHGTTCGGGTCVKQLALEGANLRGEIPDCFRNLTHLGSLDLTGNSLFGDSVILPLSVLDLFLGQNLFESADWLVMYPQLEILDISMNALMGYLPTFPVGSNLTDLYMYGNAMSGGIDTLCELDILRSVDLSQNLFSGQLPKCIFYNNTVRTLSVASNNFSGSVPEVTTDMLLLDLGSNRFEGSLEHLLEHAAYRIYYLAISDNLFHGPLGVLPITTGVLEASSNNFGASTSELADMLEGPLGRVGISLTSVDFSNCGITGELSRLLRRMTEAHPALSRLNLANNSLTGTLPVMPLPPMLETLSLNNNELTGDVPPAIIWALGTTLTNLDLSSNPNLRSLDDHPPRGVVGSSEEPIINLAGHYSCQRLTNLAGTAIIKLDPSYYGYTLCTCLTGLYGRPPSCLNVSDICNSTETCIASTNATSISFLPNFYPSPNTSHVLLMLPCVVVDNSSLCNSENLQCVVSADNAISCTGMPCQAVANDSRLCSQCAHGYYQQRSICEKCSGGYVYAVLAIGLAGSFFMTLAVMYGRRVRINRGDEEAPTRCGRFVDRVTETSIPDTLMMIIVALPGVIVNSPLLTLNVPAWLVLAIVAVFIVRMFVPLLFDREGSYYSSTNYQPWLSTQAKSFVTFMQVMTALGSTSNMGENRGGNISYLSEISCWLPLFSSYTTRLMFNQALPLIVIVVIGAFFFVKVLYICYDTSYFRGPTSRRKFNHRVKQEAEMTIALILQNLGVFTFPASIAFFSFFACARDPTPPSLIFYSAVHPYLPCYTTKWYGAAAAIITLFAVTLIISVAVGARIYILRNRLTEPAIRTAYQFFFESHKPDYYYYDSLVFVRRILVATSVAIYPNSNMFSYLIVILLLALSIHLALNSGRFLSVTILETISIFIAILCAQPSQATQFSTAMTNSLLTIAPPAMMVVYGLVTVLSLVHVLTSLNQRKPRQSLLARLSRALFDSTDNSAGMVTPTTTGGDTARLLPPQSLNTISGESGDFLDADVSRAINALAQSDVVLAGDVRAAITADSQADRLRRLIAVVQRQASEKKAQA